MVATYTILGKQVQSQWIAIGTLAVAFGGALLPSYLPKSEPTVKAAPTPVAPVASKEDDIDVEKLLDNFLKDNEEKK